MIVSIIGIVITICLTAAGIAFNIWWKRYQTAKLFLTYFTKVRGRLDGIYSIAYDKRRGLFTSGGPRSIQGQLSELAKLFADYETFKLQSHDLLSEKLTKLIEHGHSAATHTTSAYESLARPYITGAANWSTNDPSVFAVWNLNRDFLLNTLTILDQVVSALSVVGPGDFLPPLRKVPRVINRSVPRQNP